MGWILCFKSNEPFQIRLILILDNFHIIIVCVYVLCTNVYKMRLTNEEQLGLLEAYFKCDKNCTRASDLYRNKYPLRIVPTRKIPYHFWSRQNPLPWIHEGWHQVRFSLKCWVGLFHNRVFMFKIYDGRLDRFKYVEISEDLEIILGMPEEFIENMYFQQDGAPRT